VYSETVKVDESFIIKSYTDEKWDLGVAFEKNVVNIVDSVS
jgi:hypothetical protein